MDIGIGQPLFVTISHAGEWIPEEAVWLRGVPESVLLCDLDRYVDQLYQRALEESNVPSVVGSIHRFVVDLNRLETDIDCSTVEGSLQPEGMFTRGLHWQKSTRGDLLIEKPLGSPCHKRLVETYFNPFHADILDKITNYRSKGFDKIFILDLHSMPSKGGVNHSDPGAVRKDVVLGNQFGTTADADFTKAVVEAYQSFGYEVSMNVPYPGGRIVHRYGKPSAGIQAIQVELNRALYMDSVRQTVLV